MIRRINQSSDTFLVLMYLHKRTKSVTKDGYRFRTVFRDRTFAWKTESIK